MREAQPSPCAAEKRFHCKAFSLSRPKKNSATKKKIAEVVTVRACNQG